MNRNYNPKLLRDLDQLCIYKCSNCHRIVFLAYDIKDGKMPVTCKGCGHYIDGDKDIIGNSHFPDEYPEIRFTIDDENMGKGKKPMLLAWFHMECPDCKQMSWIAWRGKWFDIMTCICHEPMKKEEESVIVKPVMESIVIDQLVIPGDLVEKLKDYCFTHDMPKKDVVVEAMRKFLN